MDLHTEDKDSKDIIRFFKLNDIILKNNNRISRRVTKKEIVYKKDKSRSIVTIQILKNGGLNLFLSNKLSSLDNEKKFITISKSNCKTLDSCFKIINDDDLKYIESVITDYLDNIFNNK